LATGAAPTIVVRLGVFDLVLLLLLDWELKEVLRQSELLVDLLLAQTIVLDVEEADVMNRVLQLLRETLLSTWTVVVLEIEGDEFGPG
jgi:hypothetical protein